MNMYYKGVNRGLSFTKPGLYAVGLLLLIGMVGVATGINGLYVFLSVGMGGFVISGMISEKAMKCARLLSLSQASADAGQAFSVALTIKNESSWFAIYEMETAVLLGEPRFKLIAVPLAAPLAARAGVLPAHRATTFEAVCKGLPRGVHEQMTAVQKTTFPFGLLEKFKVVRVPARFLVGPAVDQEFLQALRARLAAWAASLDEDREFFSHRNYQARDARRDIDWRKSAARPVDAWVIKQYRARGQDAAVRIEAPWSIFAEATAESDYERRLSRLLTLMRGLSEIGKPFTIDFGGGFVVHGAEAGHEALAGAPVFKDRARGPRRIGADGTTVELLAQKLATDAVAAVLVFDGSDVSWPSGERAC